MNLDATSIATVFWQISLVFFRNKMISIFCPLPFHIFSSSNQAKHQTQVILVSGGIQRKGIREKGGAQR